MRIKGSAFKGLLLALVFALMPISSFSTNAAGPQTPSCGNYKVTKNEVIVGVKFSKGTYQVNAFGISCKKVMGSKGVFAQFLKLKDKDPLPKPWRYLTDAIGAPKFSSSPAVGFRVQLITPTATTTATPTATPTPTPEVLSITDSVDSCKIADASNPYVGVYGGALYGGFNEKTKPVPSSGTVTWYLVPVEFADLKGEASWRSRVEDQMQVLSEYYDMVSYGKLKIQWKVYENWITLPENQIKYAINQSGDYITTENFWRDAISVADPKIDFTGVQVVNFLLPRDQTAIKESAQGFPWTGDVYNYNSSEFKVSAFTILGNYFIYSYRPFWSYWAHEYGHTLGIPHLGSSRSSYSFQQYDLMADQDARRELSGWSRFSVTKWLEDKWTYCKNKININSEIVYLNDLNSISDGNKLVIIPISTTKTLLVESRRSTKFTGSQRLSGNLTGVFVYIYDSSLGHNQEYLTLLPSATDSILRTNESITYDGVTVKVLSIGIQDKILITKQS